MLVVVVIVIVIVMILVPVLFGFPSVVSAIPPLVIFIPAMLPFRI
ncbi:MAG TPA: hypothetical protein VGP35_08465 [Terriglobales bacterium]|nr:hypothetical protein [Terriglobales bacterium]